MRFENIFRKFFYPGVILNESGEIIERNENFGKLFPVENNKFSDYFPPEFQKQIENGLKKAKEGLSAPVEIIDGLHIDTKPSYRIELFNVSDETPAILAIVFETTDSKRWESKVIGAASGWRLIFDSILDPICLTDPDGQVIRCNSRFASLINAEYGNILGKSLTDWFPGLSDPGYFRQSREQASIYRNFYEWKDRVFTVKADPYIGDSGRTAGVIYILHDVTKEKAIEKEFLESEFINSEILDAIDSPIFYKDLNGIYISCNRAFCDFTGLGKDRIIGARVPDIYPEKRAQTYMKKDKELIESMGEQNVQNEEVFYGGMLKKVIINKFLIFDSNNKPQGIAGIIVDVTELKKASERIEASLHEKETLLKEIHHRVKNNLNIISSLLRLRCETTDNVEVIDILNESISRVHSMSLIHEMLYRSEDLAKIMVREYIRDLSTAVISNYNIKIGIELKLDCDDISLDIDKLIPFGLILNEMLTNSIKYSFTERHKVTINIELKKKEKGMVLLKYGDSGPGIPQRVDFYNPVTLGLQLIKDLTRQLDGTIALTREKKTYYELEFPIS